MRKPRTNNKWKPMDPNKKVKYFDIAANLGSNVPQLYV